MAKGKAQSKKGRMGMSVWNNEGIGVAWIVRAYPVADFNFRSDR